MTQMASAEYLGCVHQTILNHLHKNARYFDQFIPEVQAIKARILAPVVTEVAEVAEARIKKLFNRAFAITETLIDKAERLGDQITISEAMEIHKAITQWAAKFAASEAPRRMEFAGTVNHDHKLVPTALFAALESVMREQKLLPEVIEAEVIADGVSTD